MYYIIEVANCHGGDINYLKDLISKFNELDVPSGIKFQAFAPNTIATEDFEWYQVYKELLFSPSEWKELIELGNEKNDVWLDLFDTYGVQIVSENLATITGVKFQSSVLQNHEVIGLLSKLDLSKHRIILNIAAQPIDAIHKIIANVEQQLNPKEILLEIGFQAYPTSLEDSGLNKIEEIIKTFKKQVVFADHTDGKSDDALTLPLIAAMKGISIIEKHVMLDDRETKYDHFSSITYDRYKQMVETISRYSKANKGPFINEKEKEYLQKTQMVPMLKVPLKKGQGLNIHRDFIFRRSGKTGLNVNEISNLLASNHILRGDKKEGELIQQKDLKLANIATIIACRLKSSRLERKALLKIGELTSVELCISNCLKFKEVNHTILATSTTEQDTELENYTYDPSVIFHTGDPDDVIQRYLDIINKLKIDVIVRVTADMPFVDPAICDFLLQEHFKSGADYTVARKAAVGTNLEIISTSALQKVKDYFPSANYSEYMTWYFQNNPEFFNLHFVDLPENLIRDYRLTIDYQEDLEMFNDIATKFSSNENYSLTDIFKFLDENPNVANKNANCTLAYKTDDDLIQKLNKFTKMK